MSESAEGAGMTKEELYAAVGSRIDFGEATQVILDMAVYDMKSREGSIINNEGFIAQLGYLLSAGMTIEEVCQDLGLPKGQTC